MHVTGLESSARATTREIIPPRNLTIFHINSL